MKIITLILLLFVAQITLSQNKDTIKLEKNLRFSILGGPGYTPDYGFVIGGSALFSFSTDFKDSSLKRSIIPLAFGYMFSGGGSAVIRPQLFFNKDKFRVFGKIALNNTLENYYGVGYKKNKDTERNEDTTQYRSIGFAFNPIFYFKFKNTDLFLGASVDIAQKTFNDPSIGVQNDKDYIADGGDADGLRYFNTGIGANISYDTRDLPANAYTGILLDLGATIYSKHLGGTSDFAVYRLQYKQFKKIEFIAKRTVLAWMLDGRFTTGDVPLTDLSMIGSPFDLRGYYMGQYRDKNTIIALLEYRQMINAGNETKLKKLLSKLGYTAWLGIGSTDPDFKDWSGVMPNFGVDIRIEVQPRMNFRLDVGHDPLNGKTLMYFNMTEAF